MKTYCLAIGIMAATLFAAGILWAQDYMIYPREGQDEQQMEQDKFECYTWAKQQSGFDPMQAQAAPQTSREKNPSAGRSALKGGGVGAAVGAGIGAIAGGGKGAKRGAAIGGVTGGAAGGASGTQKQRQAEEQQAQETSGFEQQRQNYNRAFEACMEGKGYTVK